MAKGNILANTGTGTYANLEDFYTANADRVNGIAEANGVDVATARDMLASNIKGTGSYAGGGIADMGALNKAYQTAMSNGEKTASGGYAGQANGSYYDQIAALYDKQYQNQQRMIDRNTQNTIDEINARMGIAQQAYENQQRENYIQNQLSQNQMRDYLSAMGYSGGLAETTRADMENNYIDNRVAAQREYNNTIDELNRLIAQARLTGDTNLADAANQRLTALIGALENQQGYDFRQRQADQEQANWEAQMAYNREQDEYNRAQNEYENALSIVQAYLKGTLSRDAAQRFLNGTAYEGALAGLAPMATGGTSRGSGRSSGGSSSSTSASTTGFNYMEDPDYQETLANIRDGLVHYADLLRYKDAIIEQYGEPGYNGLVVAVRAR